MKKTFLSFVCVLYETIMRIGIPLTMLVEISSVVLLQQASRVFKHLSPPTNSVLFFSIAVSLTA